MTDNEKAVIVRVLCSQALADNLGDVRDAERALWGMLKVPPLPAGHPAYESGEAYPVTKARLLAAGLSLPDYLRDVED